MPPRPTPKPHRTPFPTPSDAQSRDPTRTEAHRSGGDRRREDRRGIDPERGGAAQDGAAPRGADRATETPRGGTLLALLLLIAAALLAGAARGAEFRGADEVVIAEGEVIDGDLYASGQRVEVRGRILGDLVATAQDVVVLGEVEGDLIAAGRSIELRGTVGDDARIAGAALTLLPEASVGGDLVAAGYGLDLQPGASVGGDLLFGGRQALVAGTVTGAASFGVEALQLDGVIEGDVTAETGAAAGAGGPPPALWGLPTVPVVAAGLSLGPDARLGGDLTLRAPPGTPLPPAASAAVAGETRLEPLAAEPDRPWWRGWLERALLLIGVGWALLLLAPGATGRATGLLRRRPLRSVGLGALALFATPLALLLGLLLAGALAALLSLLSLGGLGAGLVLIVGALSLLTLLLLLLATLVLAPPLAALAVGRWLLERSGAGVDAGAGSALAALVLGVVLLTLLARVPFVGALVALAVALFGLGAAWLALWSRRGSPPASGRLRPEGVEGL